MGSALSGRRDYAGRSGYLGAQCDVAVRDGACAAERLAATCAVNKSRCNIATRCSTLQRLDGYSGGPSGALWVMRPGAFELGAPLERFTSSASVSISSCDDRQTTPSLCRTRARSARTHAAVPAGTRRRGALARTCTAFSFLPSCGSPGEQCRDWGSMQRRRSRPRARFHGLCGCFIHPGRMHPPLGPHVRPA